MDIPISYGSRRQTAALSYLTKVKHVQPIILSSATCRDTNRQIQYSLYITVCFLRRLSSGYSVERLTTHIFSSIASYIGLQHQYNNLLTMGYKSCCMKARIIFIINALLVREQVGMRMHIRVLHSYYCSN